jgi:predicted ribosomally synthesized peptide with nif11-like leader
MSKENAINFLKKAAEDTTLKSQVQDVEHRDDLVALGQEHGYEFSSEHLEEAVPEIKKQQGFFGDLVTAVLSLFGPTHDDYPATGVQPYSGDPNR